MAPKKLRFFARGGLMVPHPTADQAAHGSIARYVGRRFDSSLANHKKGIVGGWPASPEGEEIYVTTPEALAECVRECREKSLWPADEETAAACGVDFDPDFGGEFDHVEHK